MPPRLAQGSIVLAEIFDPQGRNKKCRPLVIITKTDEIPDLDSFFGVAVTGSIPTPFPDDHVQLPYHRQGHAKTGLTKKSAAVCSWLVEVTKQEIVKRKGAVPNAVLEKILERIKAFPKTKTGPKKPTSS